MDDVGLQYVSPVLREVSNLARAAKAFTSDAGDLGMVLKPPKSGCIPGNQKVWGQLKRHLGTLKIPYRAHMRNLGHELTGPRVLRHMEKRRQVLHYVSWAAFQVVQFRRWGADPVVVQDPELAQVPKRVVFERPQDHELLFCQRWFLRRHPALKRSVQKLAIGDSPDVHAEKLQKMLSEDVGAPRAERLMQWLEAPPAQPAEGERRAGKAALQEPTPKQAPPATPPPALPRRATPRSSRPAA
ncbi:unnamed protein product, partial [Prorocentrum cordatum]